MPAESEKNLRRFHQNGSSGHLYICVSHWVSHSFGLVLHRSKELRKLLYIYIYMCVCVCVCVCV